MFAEVLGWQSGLAEPGTVVLQVANEVSVT
jgi:hypothetical protein